MTKDYNVLFLGGLFPQEIADEIETDSIGNVQNAANNLQWEFVKGLDSNLNEPVQIINSLYIGSFPKRYKKLFIKTTGFSHDDKSKKDINVGFLNLSGVKIFSRFYSCKPYLKKWIKNNSYSKKKKIIIAYAMTYTFTKLLKYIKKTDSSIITCLIVPDLPQYMNLESKQKLFYRILKNVEIELINKHMKYIDGYILLTKDMKEKLNINKIVSVVEGIATDKFEKLDVSYSNSQIKTIFYSGGLQHKYGIIDLVDAFKKLDSKLYRLVICGSGDSEQEIIEASTIDDRITFLGLLPRQKVLELQKTATLLVNPRKNNDSFTKYSFPSKNLEYMSSGRPLLAYKLDGIPDEYVEFIFIVPKGNNSLFSELHKVLLLDNKTLTGFGERAKNFVLEEKSPKKQGKKVLDYLINLH